ncbi:hypothetical protein SLEP1_g31666 [Rubroshorea leprosula]|uniref:Uncharacterized protein n=1 Tax=Rubroshorea leprosula TaxID=152421 RepID=A0AAV5KAP7_9ROSI|nr:hypothetical protein SLEP1_g31666 [Rubroshorea leprosula]
MSKILLAQSSTESRQCSHHDAWSLMPRHEFSIGSSNKSFGFCPFFHQYIWRSPSLLGIQWHFSSDGTGIKKEALIPNSTDFSDGWTYLCICPFVLEILPIYWVWRYHPTS